MKKLRLSGEAAYFIAVVTLAFAVAIISAADFGLSMIVAPAYLVSVKTGVLTFGMAEYAVQAVLFIAFCVVMKNFKPVYVSAFVTCLLYGAVLDLFRLIPAFNPSVTPPGSMDIRLRILYFVGGVLLTSFAIALFYKTYLYPQVYDFFVKGVSAKYGFKIAKFKTIFDLCCLIAGVALSFAFFGELRGIGAGTFVMAAINGFLIGCFGKLIDKTLEITPRLKKFAKYFDLTNRKEENAENANSEKPSV